MRHHHTKNKGDLGAIQAMADMTAKGWRILLPLSEHEAFDFVAYQGDRFLRVQAKYRTAVNGVVHAKFSTCWADRHGVHTVKIDRTAIDLLCLYCPDTARCYYLDPQLHDGETVTLRVSPARNNMTRGIRWARDFEGLPSSVCRPVESPTYSLVGRAAVRHCREPRAPGLVRTHSSAG